MSKNKNKVDHVREHLKQLVGAKILGVVDDGSKESHDRAYGLRVKKISGQFAIAWILRDPEGNGPGFLDFEDEPVVKVGDRVVAEGRITEGGAGHPGKESAKFPDPHYIHAEEGDIGVVSGVNDDGLPTVRFERTGTATIVGWGEVTPESAS